MGFSGHEHWSGLQCPPPGDLSDPGIEPASLTSPALLGEFFTTSATWGAPRSHQRAACSHTPFQAHLKNTCSERKGGQTILICSSEPDVDLGARLLSLLSFTQMCFQ